MTSKTRRSTIAALGLAAAVALAACTPVGFGPSSDLPPPQPPNGALPLAAGQTFGKGPVRVALLLPLTGDPGLTNVGQSMANAARLAMDYIEASPTIADNITIVLKDTGGSAPAAAERASEAISEEASLILGPLKADQVTAAGSVARSAGIPLIGFSNNTGAASPGVYLLNVLPEVEVKRSLGFVKTQGRQAFAAIVPTTSFGRIQQGAFTQAASELGISPRAIYTFANETEARAAIDQLIPQLQAGSIDALFIPDRATAPSFGVLLESAGIARDRLTIIGSADWDGDVKITQTAFLGGAVYPTVDDAGYLALKPEYEAKFGSTPHPLATIAYTATLLANQSSLSMGTPRYDRTLLTAPGGMNGRDGVFRFLTDGRSEYALIMKQVGVAGATRVDGPKL